MTSPAILRRAAYRRGSCIDCRSVKAAAGMPRCWPCHGAYTGIPLSRERRRAALIRSMTGGLHAPLLRVAATAVANRLITAPEG